MDIFFLHPIVNCISNTTSRHYHYCSYYSYHHDRYHYYRGRRRETKHIVETISFLKTPFRTHFMSFWKACFRKPHSKKLVRGGYDICSGKTCLRNFILKCNLCSKRLFQKSYLEILFIFFSGNSVPRIMFWKFHQTYFKNFLEQVVQKSHF